LHTIGKEALLSGPFYRFHSLHGQNRLAHKIPIVFDGSVASFFEIKGAIDGHFFSTGLTIGLGPGDLAGIPFLVEVSVAFGTAKPELFAIVSDKDHAVARVARRGTEITLFDSHIGLKLINLSRLVDSPVVCLLR